jgi:hypothetical protein
MRPSRDHGPFPVEICHRIIDFTDDVTYQSYAKVSRIFRAYCQKHFRVGGTKIVTKHHGQMEFTFIDRQAGTIADLKAIHLWNHLPKHNWSPIVGFERPSILSKVSLTFTSLAKSSVEENDSESES